MFMIQMSRGYEDERLLLQIFIMFINRADQYGRFGVIEAQDERLEDARISQIDLRVLLMCIMYN